MSATIDCELTRAGFWGQPVNATSSLAFVVIGIALMRSRPVLGVASAAVGVGSFLFHGPMPSWAEWAHDWSLVVLLVALLLESRPWIVGGSAAAVGVGFVVFPQSAEAVASVLALILVASLVLSSGPRITRHQWWALGLLVAGAGVMGLSRTAGPLCQPESLIQGHALWHLLAASALWVWTHPSERADAAWASDHRLT